MKDNDDRPARAPLNGPRVRLAAACAVALTALLAAPPAAAGDWQRDGFALKNKKAGIELALAGYLQGDFRSFRGWQVEDPLFRSDEADVRRARFGVEGSLKKLSFDVDLELGGPARDLLNDGEPPFAGVELRNAFAEYEFSKALGLRAGNFKIPVSPEFLTGASRTDLVERSLLANSLAPDREWGVVAFGELRKRIQYQAGVFVGDGRLSAQRAETTVAARVVVEARRGLELGGSWAQGDVRAQPDGPGTNPSPLGFLGRSPSGWRFYERKFVNGRRLRWGADAQYLRGPLGFKGELLQGREQRKGQGSTFLDLPEQVATGWSLTATWIVTGEKKGGSIKPKRPIGGGGFGAIELAARYESLRFDDNDNTGFEGAGNRARNLRPGQDRVLWGGASWLPFAWMRVYGNVAVERYLDALLAPEPPGARFVDGRPRERGSYVTILSRVEFLIP